MSLTYKNYRRCISCRVFAPKASFLRVVRLPATHQIQLEHGNGRSAYICPDLSCIAQAKAKNRLQSVLRTRVSEDIYQSLSECIK